MSRDGRAVLIGSLDLSARTTQFPATTVSLNQMKKGRIFYSSRWARMVFAGTACALVIAVFWFVSARFQDRRLRSFAEEQARYAKALPQPNAEASKRYRYALAQAFSDATSVVVYNIDSGRGFLLEAKDVLPSSMFTSCRRAYAILGIHRLEGGDCQRLLKSVVEALKENINGPPSECFSPSYGLEIVTRGNGIINILVCLRCNKIAYPDPVYTMGMHEFRGAGIRDALDSLNIRGSENPN